MEKEILVRKRIYEDEIAGMNKRRCFNEAVKFLDSSHGKSGKVLSLYGLRRTGKTVLMKQLALKYGVPYIYEVLPSAKMDEIGKFLEQEKGKARIVFIDEITNAEDFIENSALLPDYYASDGTDIVITGTDSFGLYLAEDQELLNRTCHINMTYISFAEHCEVLGASNLDEYIEHGGLMRRGIVDNAAITDYETARRYLDSAVSNNISSSISKKIMSPRYSTIEEYNKRDIFLAIEKVVEIYNGVFSDKIVNRVSFSPIIGMPITYQISNKKNESEKRTRYKKVDINRLREEYASIINLSCSLSHPATAQFVAEIEDALTKIGLLSRVESYYFNKVEGYWEESYREIEKYVIQPAIKFNQLQEANRLLLESDALATIPPLERAELKEHLTNDIYGKITENIVLYDTRKCLNNDEYIVCKPFFEGDTKGEYDMLVCNCYKKHHYAFEVKHSSKAVVGYNPKGDYIGQDKHLLNEDFNGEARRNFGECKGNFVLYNGTGLVSPRGTYYINIKDFLCSIDETHNLEETVSRITTNLPQKNELDLIDQNPEIYPFPIRMDSIPQECQCDLHRLILLSSEQEMFAGKTIYEKLEKKYPLQMEKVDRGEVKRILSAYRALPSYKGLCRQFKRSAIGKSFKKNFQVRSDGKPVN